MYSILLDKEILEQFLEYDKSKEDQNKQTLLRSYLDKLSQQTSNPIEHRAQQLVDTVISLSHYQHPHYINFPPPRADYNNKNINNNNDEQMDKELESVSFLSTNSGNDKDNNKSLAFIPLPQGEDQTSNNNNNNNNNHRNKKDDTNTTNNPTENNIPNTAEIDMDMDMDMDSTNDNVTTNNTTPVPSSTTITTVPPTENRYFGLNEKEYEKVLKENPNNVKMWMKYALMVCFIGLLGSCHSPFLFLILTPSLLYYTNSICPIQTIPISQPK